MEHDTSPNLSGIVHMHPLYVVVSHKSKMEVYPGAQPKLAQDSLWTMPLNSLKTYKR